MFRGSSAPRLKISYRPSQNWVAAHVLAPRSRDHNIGRDVGQVPMNIPVNHTLERALAYEKMLQIQQDRQPYCIFDWKPSRELQPC